MLRNSREAQLVASVAEDGFGQNVLKYVSLAAKFRSFGTFFIPNLRHPQPVLSYWSGKISDYWFRRNAMNILATDHLREEILSNVLKAPANGVLVELWKPARDDERYVMFQRARLIEKIAASSRAGGGGLQTFFLRSTSDGPLSQTELKSLIALLPFVQSAIALRHLIVGSEAVRLTPESRATVLRIKGLQGFVSLTKREAETCDLIARGLNVATSAREMGIAENSVRTLRQRAYRKLRVSSATEAMALMMKKRER